MNKIISCSIAFCLIIVSGSFFYYYIIFLPNYQKIMTEQERQEKEKNKDANKDALKVCLLSAETQWQDWGSVLVRKGNECNKSLGCMEAVNDAHAKNDKDLQQNKDNCFKEFPQ